MVSFSILICDFEILWNVKYNFKHGRPRYFKFPNTYGETIYKSTKNSEKNKYISLFFKSYLKIIISSSLIWKRGNSERQSHLYDIF